MLAVHDAFALAAVLCSIAIVTSLVRGPGLPGSVAEPAREDLAA